MKLLSRVWLLATPWTAAYQAPPSIEFSRQEYWNGVPLPSPTFKIILSFIFTICIQVLPLLLEEFPLTFLVMQLWWQSNFSPFDCYKSIPPSVLKDIFCWLWNSVWTVVFSTSALNMLLPCLLSYIVLTRSLQCYFVVILSICLYTQLRLILCNPVD